ncbi:MAG: MCE family protein [Spirochaetia bacterium]|nr:MCE family protein [Spirochaetia bacterium]
MKNYFIGIIFFFVTIFLFYNSVIQGQNEKVIYPYKMKLYFPTAEGLREGTEVSVKGILYGLVKEIKEVNYNLIQSPRFTTESDKAVELNIILKSPITLWDNYEIKFKSKTLFSGRMIDIDPGSYKLEDSSFFRPTYTDDDEEDGDNSPSSKYYDEFFTGANTLLTENKEDIRNTIENIRTISDKIKSGNGTLSQLINKSTAYDNLNETVSDISIIGKEARRYFEMIRENDTNPVIFTMFVVLNLLNLNLSGQGNN